jgi:PAS domain S-box-containing protein
LVDGAGYLGATILADDELVATAGEPGPDSEAQAAPLLVSGDRYALRLWAPPPRPFSAEEREVLAAWAADLGEALTTLDKHHRWREDGERLAALLRASPVSISLRRAADGRFVEVNEQFERITGFRADEVLGRRPEELGLIDPAAFERVLAAAARGEQEEVVVTAADGRRVTALLSATPLTIDGEPHVLTTGVDITSLREAEHEARRLLAAIEQSPTAVMVTDAEHRVVYTNPAHATLTGYAREEAVGQHPLAFLSGTDTESEQRRAEIVPTLAQGKAWSGRLVNRRRDGGEYIEDVTIAPVRDQTGAAAHYVCVEQDVTEQVRLNRQLLRASRTEALGQIAGGLAHDFNNILTTIVGYAELLRGQLPPDPRMRADLDQVVEAAERGAGLTRQLLAFSREQEAVAGAVDLSGLVRRMSPMIRRLIGEDIELQTFLASDVAPVAADANQLGQVVMNLAVNGRDAMPRQGRLTITVGSCRLQPSDERCRQDLAPGEWVELTVTDTGEGMAPDVVERIFEPFFTTKPTGQGTGLGLAIVQRVVSQAGGHVSVASAPGRGTTFSVLLPPGQAPDAGDDATAEAADLGRGETVLLVEDAEPVRVLAERMLTDAGYHVLSAAHGAEALGLAADHDGPLHLLLTDVVMPSMSGRELAEQLQPRRPEIAVLYTTGYTEDAILRHGLESSAIELLTKPFTAESLRAKVRAVLDAAAPPTPATGRD